jgi:hypothetical protein
MNPTQVEVYLATLIIIVIGVSELVHNSYFGNLVKECTSFINIVTLHTSLYVSYKITTHMCSHIVAKYTLSVAYLILILSIILQRLAFPLRVSTSGRTI